MDFDKTKTAMKGRNSLNLDAFMSRKLFPIDFLLWWPALLKLVITLGSYLLLLRLYLILWFKGFLFKFLCLSSWLCFKYFVSF